jgi:hypothetical protein
VTSTSASSTSTPLPPWTEIYFGLWGCTGGGKVVDEGLKVLVALLIELSNKKVQLFHCGKLLKATNRSVLDEDAGELTNFFASVFQLPALELFLLFQRLEWFWDSETKTLMY